MPPSTKRHTGLRPRVPISLSLAGAVFIDHSALTTYSTSNAASQLGTQLAGRAHLGIGIGRDVDFQRWPIACITLSGMRSIRQDRGHTELQRTQDSHGANHHERKREWVIYRRDVDDV